jgi:micrococcal nuclease
MALLGVPAANATEYPVTPQGVQGPFVVTKVVDGDTIWVDNSGQRQNIRMIGLDTPQPVDPRKPVQCFAQEASAQAKTAAHDLGPRWDADAANQRSAES